MTGGQLLVFWCSLAGLVVIFLAEVWRAVHRSRDTRPLPGHGPHARLMDEIRGHDDDG